MKINLVRLKFNDTCSYKHKPFKYCCDELKNNGGIIFTNEDLNDLGGEYKDEDDYSIPQICTSHTETFNSWGDEFEQTDNYPIQFCPHCGEKIEINVVDEIDFSEEYNELSKLRKELWDKYNKTDSKRESEELRRKVADLDDKINAFYELGEMKEVNN